MHYLAQLRNPVLPSLLGGSTDPGLVGPDAGSLATGKIISSIIGVLFLAAFILAFFYLITGGLEWISGGSDKANLEKARNKITNAFIGLIIVASAWAIMSLVAGFLGWDIMKLPLPSIGR